MLDLSQFQWLSFDCYGTLINWEAGILGYIRPVLKRKQCTVSDDRILNLYSEFEPRRQELPYRTYREVLADVMRDFAGEFRDKPGLMLIPPGERRTLTMRIRLC